jgi:glutathione S-transferase
LYEAFAIVRYLVDNKAQDDKLYPKDIKKRALIDMIAGHINDLRVAQGSLL